MENRRFVRPELAATATPRGPSVRFWDWLCFVISLHSLGSSGVKQFLEALRASNSHGSSGLRSEAERPALMD